jgi:TfoX/Sxy family transcriptional regulator of competence genes
MAYDEDLANRIRELLARQAGVHEKAMFGGLAFVIDGHMAVAVSSKGGLMVRVPPAETDKLLGRAHVSPMVMSAGNPRVVACRRRGRQNHAPAAELGDQGHGVRAHVAAEMTG